MAFRDGGAKLNPLSISLHEKCSFGSGTARRSKPSSRIAADIGFATRVSAVAGHDSAARSARAIAVASRTSSGAGGPRGDGLPSRLPEVVGVPGRGEGLETGGVGRNGPRPGARPRFSCLRESSVLRRQEECDRGCDAQHRVSTSSRVSKVRRPRTQHGIDRGVAWRERMRIGIHRRDGDSESVHDDCPRMAWVAGEDGSPMRAILLEPIANRLEHERHGGRAWIVDVDGDVSRPAEVFVEQEQGGVRARRRGQHATALGKALVELLSLQLRKSGPYIPRIRGCRASILISLGTGSFACRSSSVRSRHPSVATERPFVPPVLAQWAG